MSVAVAGVSWIALALFTTISMPPNFSAASSSPASTPISSRTSPAAPSGGACPRHLVAHIDRQRQRASTCLRYFSCGSVYRAFKFGVRLNSLGGNRDVGALGGGLQPDREADSARAAGDE